MDGWVKGGLVNILHTCVPRGLGQQILLKAVVPEFWLPRLRVEQTVTALVTGANYLHVPPGAHGRTC